MIRDSFDDRSFESFCAFDQCQECIKIFGREPQKDDRTRRYTLIWICPTRTLPRRSKITSNSSRDTIRARLLAAALELSRPAHGARNGILSFTFSAWL